VPKSQKSLERHLLHAEILAQTCEERCMVFAIRSL
jgi:hypothetical protein